MSETTNEPVKSPEKISLSEYTALHSRFALVLKSGDREVLNPEKKDLPEVEKNQLETDLKKMNFDLFNHASDKERERLAAGKTVEGWAEEFAAVCQKDLPANIDYFLKKILAVSDRKDITKDTFINLYQEYFGNDGKTDYSVFINKLQAIFTKEEIIKNLEAIKWFANIFGDQSAEVVQHLVLTIDQLATNPDNLVTNANIDNRRNNPDEEKEKPVLRFVYENSLESNISQAKTDDKFEDLKKDRRFPPEEWENMKQIRRALENSESQNLLKQLPVYYPASGTDIVRPLAMTDGENFVYVCDTYADKDNKDVQLLIESINEIGGVIESDTKNHPLGGGKKRVIKFDWGGKKRTINLYGEDATKFTPEEFRNGYSFILLSAPTGGKETSGNLERDMKSRARLFNGLAVGGYINEFPLLVLDPEIIGFQKIVNNKPETLYAPYKDGIYPLFKKINQVKVSPQLLELDRFLLVDVLGTRNGAAYEPKPENFKEVLAKLKLLFAKLSLEEQNKVLPQLKKLLASEEISPAFIEEIKKYGGRYGLNTDEAIKQHIEHFKKIALEVFPELGGQDELTKITKGRGLDYVEKHGWEEYRKRLKQISYADMIAFQIKEIERLKQLGQRDQVLTKEQIVNANLEAKQRAKQLTENLIAQYGKNKNLPFVAFYTDEKGGFEKSKKFQIVGREVDLTKSPLTRFYLTVYNRCAPEAYASLYEACKEEGILDKLNLTLNLDDCFGPGSEEINFLDNMICDFKIPFDETVSLVEMPNEYSYDGTCRILFQEELMLRVRNSFNPYNADEVYKMMQKWTPDNSGMFKDRALKNRRKYMPAILMD